MNYVFIERQKKKIIQAMWHATMSLFITNFVSLFCFCECGAPHSARSFLLQDMICGQCPWCATSWCLCILYHLSLWLVALQTWNVDLYHHYPFSLCYNFVWGLYDPHIVLVIFRKKSTPCLDYYRNCITFISAGRKGSIMGPTCQADTFSLLFLTDWVKVLNLFPIIGSPCLTCWKNGADTWRARSLNSFF